MAGGFGLLFVEPLVGGELVRIGGDLVELALGVFGHPPLGAGDGGVCFAEDDETEGQAVAGGEGEARAGLAFLQLVQGEPDGAVLIEMSRYISPTNSQLASTWSWGTSRSLAANSWRSNMLRLLEPHQQGVGGEPGGVVDALGPVERPLQVSAGGILLDHSRS